MDFLKNLWDSFSSGRSGGGFAGGLGAGIGNFLNGLSQGAGGGGFGGGYGPLQNGQGPQNQMLADLPPPPSLYAGAQIASPPAIPGSAINPSGNKPMQLDLTSNDDQWSVY